MTVQDLNVLINLAERARQAGLIKFEEFDVVATAIKGAVTQLQTLQATEKPIKEKPVKTSKAE